MVAWDFAGVLNRNVVDGCFVWSERFEEDTGQSLALFQDHVFARDFEAVLTGRVDLRDRVAGWATAVGYAPGPDALMDYWFARDMRLDAVALALADRLAERGVPQVVATNNEPRRARHIEQELGLGARVGPVFASGRMGVAKPEAAFFAAVTDALGAEPAEMLLLDDHAPNLEAARRLGWATFHVTDATRTGIAHALPL